MRRANRGSALLHSLLLLGALLAVTAATLAVVVPERHFVQRERAQRASFHLAWSGLEGGLYALEKGKPFPLADAVTRAWPADAPPDGTYEVSVSSDPDNERKPVKLFRLTSTGILSAPRVSRTLTAVVIQENFAQFSYFSDSETSPETGERAWWRKEEEVDGPVHTNGALNIAWDPDSSNRTPIFSDKVTSGANDIRYYPRPPGNSGEFRGIFSSGPGSLVLGANPVSFPGTNENQKQAALAGTTEPDEDGIVLPANGTTLTGGIFIKGDVTVRFDVEDGKQVLSLEQEGENYRLLLDPGANLTTLLKAGDPPRVYRGIPNGMIYSTGDVTSLGGTVMGRYTVCTDSEGRVVVTDHLILLRAKVCM
ncbi:MAG: hypothetical protein HYU64_11535 [Armatimonadetes bacterium]|nr:hypothetical protein [Armatimonadota bacterium]